MHVTLLLAAAAVPWMAVHAYNLTAPDYNRQVRPNEGGATDVVDIGIFTNSIRTVSEIDMTIVLDVFLQAEWYDPRLIGSWNSIYQDIHGFHRSQCRNSLCNETTITMGRDFAQLIWKPDFYLPQAIKIVPADNYNDNVCVRFRFDGKMFYSNRFIITHSCPMKLAFFPFDKHTCVITIGSYKYHDGLVSMIYSPALSGMYDDQETANFIVEPHNPLEAYSNESSEYMGDYFTLHMTEMHITRKYKIFMVTLYLPSVSLVALSWVNFWIDVKAIPARAGLSITAILAQITLIVGMASRFPSVSDLKMADLYLTVNFMYTFGTLIEFAVVSYTPKEVRNPRPPKKQRELLSFLPSRDSREPDKPSSTNPAAAAAAAAASSKEPPTFNPDHSPLLTNGTMTLTDGTTMRFPLARHREGRHFKPPPVKEKVDIDNMSKLCFPTTFLIWNAIFFAVNIQMADRYDFFAAFRGFLPT